MSRSRELFMQQREMSSLGDDSDYQYFEWLTDKQWQEYLDEEEKRYHTKYGYGVTFHLMWNEFLIKNNLK